MPAENPYADGAGSCELAARWSALHHDLDPHSFPLLSGWLRLMWAGGGVLVRAGVPPTAVTIAGVGLAGTAVIQARLRPAAALIAVIAAAVCDGLDGATAVVGDRATRSGAVADAVADRVCDGAFAVVLWHRGASRRMAATAAGLAWGVDGLRRLRRVPDLVTVAERPTFTVCAALACSSAAFSRERWPAQLSAAVWVGAGVFGVGQLLLAPTSPSDDSHVVVHFAPSATRRR